MCCKRRTQQRALYAQQLQQEAQGYQTTSDAFGNKIVVPATTSITTTTVSNPPAPYAPYGGCGSRRQRRCGNNAYYGDVSGPCGTGNIGIVAAPVYGPVRREYCGGGYGYGYRRERRGGLISLVVGLIVDHYEKKKEERREEEKKALDNGVERGVIDANEDEEVAVRVAGEQKHELGVEEVDAGNIKYRDVDEKGLDGLPSYEVAVSK